MVVGAGLALLARVGPGGDYLGDVLPGVTVLGLGLAIMVAPLTAAVLAAAPAEQAGMASAINNDVARAAALVAVAVVPALAGIRGKSYLHAAVFSAAFHRAMYLTAGACALGAAIALLTIRNRFSGSATSRSQSTAVEPEGPAAPWPRLRHRPGLPAFSLAIRRATR